MKLCIQPWILNISTDIQNRVVPATPDPCQQIPAHLSWDRNISNANKKKLQNQVLSESCTKAAFQHIPKHVNKSMKRPCNTEDPKCVKNTQTFKFCKARENVDAG